MREAPRLGAAAVFAFASALGCAQILGLEPPEGGAAGSAGTSGSTAGGSTCIGDCPSGVRGARLVTGPMDTGIRSIAFNNDSLFIAGSYSLGLELPGCALPAPASAGSGSYVARLGLDLKCQWLAPIAGDKVELVGIAASFAGVWAIGTTNGMTTVGDAFGGSTTITSGASDALLVSFSEEGKLSRAFTIGSEQDDKGRVVAAGDFVFAAVQVANGGAVRGEDGEVVADSNLGAIVPGGNISDIAVVAFEPSGKVRWRNVFGSEGEDEPSSLSVWNDDRLLIGGSIGANPLVPSCFGGAMEPQQAFMFDVEAFQGTVNPDVCDLFSPGAGHTTGLLGTPDGLVVSAGYTAGATATLCGGQGVPASGSESTAWLRVSKPNLVNPADVKCTGAEVLDGEDSSAGPLGLQGSQIIFGSTYKGVEYGGGETLLHDIFIGRYDLELNPSFSLRFGWKGEDILSSLVVTPGGRVFVAGTCKGLGPKWIGDCGDDGDGFIVELDTDP